ncbi:calcium-binding protein [Thalassovita mediterranea]|uniref:Poly(Beta-D-mannuronate) C5 epimerase 1 n=1 Tax=Thalassovita mediterranea TaxID=340021 RepID=A0A0P1H4X0_9RHOB|nr:calcium-binding protein [Thalassovita mediterranea]CUH85810.1 Poly(beta-D-mannuronate) C5 epimerase 1 [Thalassovita mediterranea]SIS32581.1 Hemolysin-type calcium-binding repeat-containing protein [Thalassovita mediterranea]
MSMNERDPKSDEVKEFIGTTDDDQLSDGAQNEQGQTLRERLAQVDKVNGHAGDDNISTGQGNDLAAGDMVGDEWAYVDGKWVYNPAALQVSDVGTTRSYDDDIRTGDGDDVLLGNGGNDTLSAGRGDDVLNAGRGNDLAYGGEGDDLVNLEQGNDTAEGGLGADTINAGDGDDVVYGDLRGGNILSADGDGLTSFSQYGESAGWVMEDQDGIETISQSANTVAGESYTISFELAANLSGGHGCGKVEVLWNGEVVSVVETTTGVYETHQVEVTSTGQEGQLSFRAVPPEGAVAYDFSGPVASYEKITTLNGQEVEVAGFAPGQSTLYQVINGQLKAFDPDARTYVDVGDPPGFKINAVGFNAEDDLIYGVAKSNGVDALGNPVRSTDTVMIDANGDAFRVGDGFYGDYVGDFDDSGNLWTFHTTLDRISVVDVDNRDADGNPEIQHFHLPRGLFTDRTYDLAYNSEDGHFYAVVSPGKNGEAGKVVQIDVSEVAAGGHPTFNEVPITGTLYGDTMESGMASGAYGAVFLDGDGNLYYGLNRGDHDLDGSTAAQGGIFRVEVDWDTGQAYSEFMSEAQSTGSNDGTVDPRSADAFTDIDADSPVLLRNPQLIQSDGGNDDLRGGAGNDQMFGNAGDDTLHGGEGADRLSGNQGNDNMSGGTGADTLTGGSGDDHLWGGNWRGDGTTDTFVVSHDAGRDIIHDFETDHDRIDLSAYGLDYAEVEAALSDRGWATELDLSALAGDGSVGDRLLLKSVDVDDLDESNFIL